MAMSRNQLTRISVCSTLCLILLAFVLHPYTRQLAIGPHIRGKPLCYWQDVFRARAEPNPFGGTFTSRLLHWLGLTEPGDLPEFPDDPDMLPVLLSLTEDPSYEVRRQVVERLANASDNPEAAAAVIRMLDDPNTWVRAWAAYSISRKTDRFLSARSRLTEMLDDKERRCRVNAAYSICLLTEHRPVNKIIAVVREALGDEDMLGTIVLIGGWLGRDAEPILPEVDIYLARTARGDARSLAACHLYKCGPLAIPIIIKLLDGPSTRAHAAKALGRMGPDALSAIPALNQSLGDSRPEVREAVREALHRIEPGP